uniref:Uncharacterized protein n=1 Tax=Solanum lycopersicum TaxID=4081 RepID=A0A3Q7FZS1_SOLLC
MARQLKEKEVEVCKAFCHNAELEAQTWQARARAQEFTATTLQTQLQAAAGDDDVNNKIIHTYMSRIRGIIEPFKRRSYMCFKIGSDS